MKVVDSLPNRPEETVLNELEKIASDNALRVFAKMRLSDAIQKESTHLTNREFDFYTRSHCDFVVVDADTRPVTPFYLRESRVPALPGATSSTRAAESATKTPVHSEGTRRRRSREDGKRRVLLRSIAESRTQPALCRSKRLESQFG